MIDDFKPIKNVLDPRLAPDERDAMRRSFFAHMDANPMRDLRPVKSPYFPIVRTLSYALVALLLVSGPVVYAAETSLPNDAFYPIKTALIEPVILVSVSWSDELATDVRTGLVDRRLREAETLAARDELEVDTAADLSESINESVALITSHVRARSEAADYGEALEAGSDIETVLEAHERVLSKIADEDPGETTFADEISALGNATEDYNEQVEDAQRALPGEDVALLSETKQLATDAIATLADTIEATETEDPEAEELLQNAEEALQDANKFSDENAQEEALARAREALENAEQGSLIIDSISSIDAEVPID